MQYLCNVNVLCLQTVLTLSLCVCLCVCVRFLSGSCLSGQSATQPAATCKASTTWSHPSLLSTSSNTSVSAISLISCVICYWCDDLHFYCKSCSPQWRVTLYAGTTWGNQPCDPSRRSFFSQLSSQWTPLCLCFLSLFFHLSAFLLFRSPLQTQFVFKCACEHYLSKPSGLTLTIRLWEHDLQAHVCASPGALLPCVFMLCIIYAD